MVFEISVDLRGVKNYTTDENGEVNISTRNLVPDNYKVKITFNENSYYLGTSAETAVIIKKANTKLSVESSNDGASLIITLMDCKDNPVNGSIRICSTEMELKITLQIQKAKLKFQPTI